MVATAACRDAKNGKAFVAEAERICRTKVEIISGKREAELSALGVVCGFHRPDGIVGDLGGGSLELSEVHGHKVHTGITLPLGGLALQDVTEKSIKKAEKLVRKALGDAKLLKAGANRTFYAIGGTWRALARLHMWQTGYPLHVMHGYVMPAREAYDFAGLVHRVNAETLSQIEVVADARRPLLAYAAVVLENLIDIARPKDIVISALGVREGLLYGMLERRRAAQGSADRGRAGAQRAALALAGARRGADRLDRPLHGLDRPRRDRRGAPPAPRRLPAGRYRLARASRLSRRAVAQHHRQCRLRRDRSSRAASISRSRCSSAMSGWSTRSCRRASASWPRPACSTAPACSARRCASPISSRRRPPACCRRRRWWSSAAALVLRFRNGLRDLAGERVFVRLRQLARLIGREPVMELE